MREKKKKPTYLTKAHVQVHMGILVNKQIRLPPQYGEKTSWWARKVNTQAPSFLFPLSLQTKYPPNLFIYFFILPKIPLPNTPLVFLLYLCLYFTSTSPYVYVTSLSSCTCSLISLCLTQPTTCSCLNGSSSVANWRL